MPQQFLHINGRTYTVEQYKQAKEEGSLNLPVPLAVPGSPLQHADKVQDALKVLYPPVDTDTVPFDPVAPLEEIDDSSEQDPVILNDDEIRQMAKDLGISGVHMYKDMKKLLAKIDEVLKENEKQEESAV